MILDVPKLFDAYILLPSDGILTLTVPEGFGEYILL